MQFVTSFCFPDKEAEWDWRLSIRRTCYNTMYPFGIFPDKGLDQLVFSPVTILYGGNGSGKSTVLNVIGEKLRLKRETPYNRSNFFDEYVDLCTASVEEGIPPESRIITSDDVFDYLLNIRSLNEGIDREREKVFTEYLEAKHSVYKVRSLNDYDELKRRNSARRKTQSAYTREQLMENVREQSNGESAIFYFQSRIEENNLYLLDEPENSLSAENQEKLADFLAESSRFFGCQLIIATHSPYLLALPGAKVYDLDSKPVQARDWYTLPNIRRLRDFFHKRDYLFELPVNDSPY